MASGMVCYHHRNCLDVPAVGTCSVCGKGLCKECFDKFKSPSTGKAVCVDCLNKELKQSSAKVEKIATLLKREQKRMIIGAIIGGIIPALFVILGLFEALSNGDFSILIAPIIITVFLASFGGSYFTIHKWAWQAGDALDYGFLIKLIVRLVVFIALLVAAPVIFIIRIVKKNKNTKRMLELRDYYNRYISNNNNFLLIASTTYSGPMSKEAAEELKRQLLLVKSERDRAIASKNKMDKEMSELKFKILELTSNITELQDRLNKGEDVIEELNKQLEERTKLEKQIEQLASEYEAQQKTNDEKISVLQGQYDEGRRNNKKKDKE